MIETKVIQVRNDPNTINEVNGIWGSFGWKVINVQITFSQNTETYTKLLDYLAGTGVNTVETTTVNYATITYQRDTSEASYSQKASLERDFQGILEKMDMLENEGIPGEATAGMLIKGGIALCVIVGLSQFLYFDSVRILLGLVVAVLGPVVICKAYEQTKGKKIEEIKKQKRMEYKALKRRLGEILEQAAGIA